VVFGKIIILVEERDHRTAVAMTIAHSAAGTITKLLLLVATSGGSVF
jgi:hypothetical protein